MPSQGSGGWLGQTRRAAAWLRRVALENAGGAVYGTMMIGVLFAAENARHEGYPATIEAAAIILVVFRLTSFYAHTLADPDTILEVVSCGRFTDDERLLYHQDAGLPPFHVLGPNLPPGYEETKRAKFSIHRKFECWDRQDLERLRVVHDRSGH